MGTPVTNTTDCTFKEAMEKLDCEHIHPGAVVFGRVTSYPWWPAIVARCPTTSEWNVRNERTWVFFFNDDTGAWLKERDMRPFSASTREAVTKINSSNPRFRKYLERITGACQLAQEYLQGPLGTRTLSQYNTNLTVAALQQYPGTDISSGIDNLATYFTTKPTEDHHAHALLDSIGNNDVKNRRILLESNQLHDQVLQNQDLDVSVQTTKVDHDTIKSTVNTRQRPRRYRKKSAQYLALVHPLKRDHKRAKSKTQDWDENKESLNQNQAILPPSENSVACTPIRNDRGTPNISRDKGAKISGTKRMGSSSKGAIKKRAKGSATVRSMEAVHSESSEEPPNSSRNHGESELRSFKSTPCPRASQTKGGYPASVFTKTNVEASHLTRMVAGQIGRPGGEKVTKPILSFSGFVSSTDEHLSKPRPVIAGADDNVHHLQSRVDAAERHARLLQENAPFGVTAEFRDDPSAVAVREAVVKLTRAVEELARSRGYNADRIRCGIDALWSHPKSKGASNSPKVMSREEAFVESLARSLVWTAWQKNRKSQRRVWSGFYNPQFDQGDQSVAGE